MTDAAHPCDDPPGACLAHQEGEELCPLGVCRRDPAYTRLHEQISKIRSRLVLERTAAACARRPSVAYQKDAAIDVADKIADLVEKGGPCGRQPA